MAGIQDKYPHLPGHLTEFKDGGLQLTQEVNPPATESILLLGTSVDGPIMEPVKVDASTYEAVFGKAANDRGVPNGSTLAIGFEEAYAAGCRDIRLMRVSGSVAKAVIKGAESRKVEDKVFEGILGIAGGNSAANSAYYLADIATKVLEVQANGTVLTSDQYDVELEAEVANAYTDGKQVYKADELSDVLVVSGTNIIVEIAKDDIYENTTTLDKVWGTSLNGDFTGHTLVAQAGVDHVVKGEVLAQDAYVDAVTVVVGAKATSAGVVVTKVVRTKVTLKDSVCDNGSFVVVRYEDKEGNVPVENASDVSGSYKAAGSAMTFELNDNGESIVPVMGMVKLYFDGVEYTEMDTLVEDSNVKVFNIVRYKEEGKDKARLVINPGKHAKRGSRIEVRLLYKKTVSYIPELKLETSFGGFVYNETQYTVETVVHAGNFVEKILKVYKPKSKKAQVNEEPLTYSTNDYPTLGLLARAINNDERNMGFVKAILATDVELTDATKLDSQPTPKNFEGGDDGINLTKQQIFSQLSGKRDAAGDLLEVGAYQLLENYSVDYVIPLGVFADDELLGKDENFAYELGLFCAVVSHRNHTTMGVIATSSPEEASLRAIEEHVQKLERYNNLYFMKDRSGNIIRDSENNPIDLGRFISVLAGGDMILNNTRLGVYANNSAAAIAGYVSQLAPNSAPTNKVIPFARGLKVKYSNAQLERLTANRFITLKYKGDGGAVAIVDAMTCARPGSDYERQNSMRAVRIVANDIRVVADPFLGEPNSVNQRNALSALIDKKLGQHKEAGTIKDYSFQIIASAYDELIGQCTIELTIVPSQELRKITTIISLKPNL